jgi:hypothetical protein
LLLKTKNTEGLSDNKGMLEELSLQRLEKVTPPRHMSVDKVAWQKWHKYVTNGIDIDKRKVIWNHEGQGKTVLDSARYGV